VAGWALRPRYTGISFKIEITEYEGHQPGAVAILVKGMGEKEEFFLAKFKRLVLNKFTPIRKQHDVSGYKFCERLQIMNLKKS
jgi:hypothetical protein